MSDIEKFPLESMNITAEQKKKLKQLFPEVFTEGDKIDWDKLRLTLGESVDVGKERFGMNWPGKADCFKIIQQPSLATLVPARDESVNFDTTENLFIEGDNLEVLKLLQKSYLGKIKMIYIDPPYNTGNDFIYPDNYSETLETYLAYTGQVDSEGRKFSTNTDTEGRFHSKWMNMMYPRLFLAKNLLKEDGVIFISIDDNEVKNLISLCDEIFGEENFVGQIINKSNPRGSQEPKGISTEHEYILCYVKEDEGTDSILGRERGENDEEFDYKTEDGKNARLLGLRKRGGDWRRSDRPNMYYPFYVNPNNMRVSLIRSQEYNIEVFPVRPDNQESRWTWGKETSQKRIMELIGKRITRRGEIAYDIYRIDRLEDETGQKKREKIKSIWDFKELNYQHARGYFKELFGSSEMFDFPKPPELIKKMIESIDMEEDIILDFFAGSATTAHATIMANLEDVGKRKFICIQIPELTSEISVAYQAGYKTIAEIGKERIRRVIKKIEEEQKQSADMFTEDKPKQDLGFKVFKLAPSNFATWNANVDKTAEAIGKQLELHINHISESADQEAILYELLLKSGFELTTKIEKLEIEGKTVFSIGEGALFVCLEKNLTLELFKEITKRKPVRIICLDEGFQNNDQLKTNVVQTIKMATKEGEEKIVFRTV